MIPTSSQTYYLPLPQTTNSQVLSVEKGRGGGGVKFFSFFSVFTIWLLLCLPFQDLTNPSSCLRRWMLTQKGYQNDVSLLLMNSKSIYRPGRTLWSRLPYSEKPTDCQLAELAIPFSVARSSLQLMNHCCFGSIMFYRNFLLTDRILCNHSPWVCLSDWQNAQSFPPGRQNLATLNTIFCLTPVWNVLSFWKCPNHLTNIQKRWEMLH